MTDPIVAFLNARLDDDQRIAEAVIDRLSERFADFGGFNGEWRNAAFRVDLFSHDGAEQTQASHIARFDPRRVLADVEAKRAILTRLVHDIEFGIRYGDEHFVACSCGWETVVDDPKNYDVAESGHLREVAVSDVVRRVVVRLLVQPFRDHPDFDPSWAS